MNVTRDRWIPCRFDDGRISHVSIAELSDPSIRNLATTRPDFTGALALLLIAILQMALKPRTDDDWRNLYRSPLKPDEFAAALEPLHAAFELASENRPAFFQDLELPDDTPRHPIDDLLIDRGSDSNLHFNHPPQGSGFCPCCTALALATLQLNSPSGGRGIRTSVRGGGPMTTLFLPAAANAPLWEMLWLNVLPLKDLGVTTTFDANHALPWVQPTRTSDGPTGMETHPGDVHPLQVLWSFSRRIRLVTDDCSVGTCTVCGIDTSQRFHTIQARHGGTNYAGPWIHPHTPYHFDAKGVESPQSIKGGWGRHAYRHWVGLALRRPDQDAHGPTAATIVQLHPRQRWKIPVRLWCFGYEMDNAKARNWYESVLPLHDVPDEQLPSLRLRLLTALDGAEGALSSLNKAVRDARFTGAGKVKGHWAPIVNAFWSTTEADFYILLESLTRRANDADDSEDEIQEATERWRRELRYRTLALFDTYVLGIPLEGHNAEPLVRARRDLEGALYASRAMKQMRKAGRTGSTDRARQESLHE